MNEDPRTGDDTGVPPLNEISASRESLAEGRLRNAEATRSEYGDGRSYTYNDYDPV